MHAALSAPARLRIMDTLAVGDASPSELATVLTMPSNLVAHHLSVLEREGLVVRAWSEGDHRRAYVRLVPGAQDVDAPGELQAPPRIVFVCSANSARSHLAAALWRSASAVPAACAGTRPADRIHPGAIAAAERHRLTLPLEQPRLIDDVERADDLIVTVCDLAHESLGRRTDLHWSISDPVRIGDEAAFDQALDDLARRVDALAARISVS